MPIVNNNYIVEQVGRLRRLMQLLKEAIATGPEYRIKDVEQEADDIVETVGKLFPNAEEWNFEPIESREFDPRELAYSLMPTHHTGRCRAFQYLEDMADRGMGGFEIFDLTEVHLAAISRLYIHSIYAFDGEIPVPCASRQRPFGNSAIEADLAKILGFEWDAETGELTPDEQAQIKRFAEEIPIALQICTRNLSFKPGRYVASSIYNDYWLPIEALEVEGIAVAPSALAPR